jgi:hypothetical protein
MSYVQITRESFDALTTLKSKYPQYKDLIESIESELNLRLWHQLSENLILLSEKPELQNSSDLIDLYNRLVASVESAFNPMKLMILIQNILKNYQGNLEQALNFLDQLEIRLAPKGEEGLYLRILKGTTYLELGKLYECEDIIKGLKFQLEKNFEVDQIIYSQFYRLSAYFYDKKGNFDEFYNNSLQFLAYVKEHVNNYNNIFKFSNSQIKKN